MTTRGSYVHNSMVEFSGASRNVSFMQFSQKIDGFRQKDSTGLLELIQLYKQNPFEQFIIFTIYQNYTLALICSGVEIHSFSSHIRDHFVLKWKTIRSK